MIHDLARVGFLVVGWSGRYENRLPHALLKFLELERPVVQRRRQAKAIFHQCGLARAVAVVHGRKLPNHLVALVQEHDGVLGHVVGQRAGRVSRRCTRQVARVVFNALAVPYFAEHFQVKPGALLQPLGFHQFAVGHQLLQALGQLQLDGLHRCQHLVTRGDVVAAGVHGKARNLLLDAPRERVEQLQALDLIIKQLDANGQLGVFCREHVDRVAAHPELATRKIGFVALVLHADELRNHVALAQLVPHAQRHHHAVIALGLANTVDGRHGGHDHHVAPFHQALGATQAHLLDVLIDRAVLLDEQVALRHIGFGLVVVVVADEILHRVLGEELSKLAVQLCRQGLVGRKNDGRAAHAGDDIGHGEGLARASHAQQRLEGFAIPQPLHQLVDGLRLVASGGVRLKQLKR